MPSAAEASGAITPLAGDLAEGVKAIALNQQITFTRYKESILPLDGYRFWVRAAPIQTITVLGSLHYSSDTNQEETENYTLNRVVFTSLQDIDPVNAVAPVDMWIADFDGMQFAFNSRGSFYKQTNLFHYSGTAVYPDMMPQVVRSADELQTDRVIVSNSLPLWLALNALTPIPPDTFANPLRLYPSFLAPGNLRPPFGSVHIRDESTAALMSAPIIGSDGSHWQLVSETVKITLYGLRNDEALTFVDCVNQYSLDYGTFGIMNMPVIRDEKRPQSELSTLAQKKSVEFEISYYQATARAMARQLITTARVAYILGT